MKVLELNKIDNTVAMDASGTKLQKLLRVVGVITSKATAGVQRDAWRKEFGVDVRFALGKLDELHHAVSEMDKPLNLENYNSLLEVARSASALFTEVLIDLGYEEVKGIDHEILFLLTEFGIDSTEELKFND